MSVEKDTIDGGDAETSLRDDLASALSDIRSRDEGEAGAAPAGTEAAGEEAAKPARADGREANGRFAGKPKDTAEAAPGQGADGVEPGASGAEAAAPAGEAATAPKSWRQEEAAEWAAMTPKAREAVLRREKEIAATIGRQDGERLFGKEVADIFRPHADEIAQAGATPQLALQTMLANHKALRSQNPQERVDTARRLLAEYGVDPRALAQPDPRFPQDPHILSLMRQVENLNGQLARQGGQAVQYAPLPGPEQDDNISPDIEAFRSDPAHPHFNHVAGHMAGLIESGAAPDLESAYQMAVLANPALRSTPAAPAVEPAQRSQEKVAAARRAAVSVQGSAGASGDPKPSSLREELKENLRRVGLA